MSVAARLYRGEVSYDYIGKRRRWYTLSSVVVLISILSLIFRGFNYGIDFKGGSSFQFPANGHSIADVRQAMTSVGVSDAVVTELRSTDGARQFRVTTGTLDLNPKPGETVSQERRAEDALVTAIGVSPSDLNPGSVGASWGAEITKKALQGLVAFLILVVGYIALRFEPKMAAAAIIALVHDLIITAGVYSIVGFEVTPSTVIALLTILGFSLYDTVVVFDKVRENTAGIGPNSRLTYSQAANLAVNQTIMRSINTSLIALAPVAALLFVGAGLLGAGTLKDLALAQFVGLASGAYSSIFVATPLLTDFKEREPQMRALQVKVARAAAKAGTTVSSPASSRAVATAVLDRDPDGELAAERQVGATQAFRAPAPTRHGTDRRQQARKRGGRPGRPSGKKRR